MASSEARRNAGRNLCGSSVAHALNAPLRALPRAGGEPPGRKNYSKQHRNYIKQVQAAVKAKSVAEAAAGAKPGFKMKKFAKATPKVYSRGCLSTPGSGETKHSFLKKGAGRAAKDAEGALACDGDNDNPPSRPRSKPRVPEHTQLNELAARVPMDFVSRNRKTVSQAVPEKKDEHLEPGFTEKPGFGRVPLYIHRRKMEIATKEMQKRAEEEKEKLPPGMTLMSEEERQRTVELLTHNQAKLVKDIGDMPLMIETPSMVERHNMLHEKLREVEEALKLFSRKKVYITA